MTMIYPQSTGMPTPIGTLDELITGGTQASTPVKVFIAHNLGNRTFLLTVPMFEFYRMSDVANDRAKHGEGMVQRRLDPEHARKLAIYILKGLVSTAIFANEVAKEPIPEAFNRIQARLGRQPYLSMQPIVANLRNCDKLGANVPGYRMVTKEEETACFKVMLSQQHIMWIVDGQHRRKAMDLVFNFLDYVRTNQEYPKRKQSLFESDTPTAEELQVWERCYEVARTHASVQVELHLGLDPDEERQLFHDLNNLGKRVEKNLVFQFDKSNPINNFISKELVEGRGVEVSQKDTRDWDDDGGSISYKELVAINAHLFLNKTNINSASPPIVDARIPVAQRYWTAVLAIPGVGEESARKKTVAAQPVVLKALAKLTFDFAFGRKADSTLLDKLLDGITAIDFSHNNPMWRYYEFNPIERSEKGLQGLAAYLPSENEGKNRDIGAFMGGYMRFGAKHNDIFPIIGDMIRWKLGLPNRHDGSPDEEFAS